MTLRKAAHLWPAAFVLVFAALTLSGSQCSEVADRSVGPDAGSLGSSNGVSACVQACNDTAKNARTAEQALHKANLQACTSDACREAENARHDARMDEIAAQSQACKEPCHEQGSGGGGQ